MYVCTWARLNMLVCVLPVHSWPQPTNAAVLYTDASHCSVCTKTNNCLKLQIQLLYPFSSCAGRRQHFRNTNPQTQAPRATPAPTPFAPAQLLRSRGGEALRRVIAGSVLVAACQVMESATRLCLRCFCCPRFDSSGSSLLVP